MENFEILASLCSSTNWFESYLVENPEGRFSRDEPKAVVLQLSKIKDLKIQNPICSSILVHYISGFTI